MPSQQSYQLHIQLSRSANITVGRLGTFTFPAGQYIYTGSAKRNLEARIQRHLSKNKKRRWHIDYLLAHRNIRVVQVLRSTQEECLLNQKTNGKVIVPGFGASDCRAGCGSHLKMVAVGAELFSTSRSRTSLSGCNQVAGDSGLRRIFEERHSFIAHILTVAS